jgi:hypothetical protein
MQPPTLAPLLLLHGDRHDSGSGRHQPQRQLQQQEEEVVEPREEQQATRAAATAGGDSDAADVAPSAATDEQQAIVVDTSLFLHSVASYPLDHVSEPTTAHTTASHLHPASYAQFVLEQEQGGQQEQEAEERLDLAVGPVRPKCWLLVRLCGAGLLGTAVMPQQRLF